MTYKELLNLYKKGELSEEQKKSIKADIEKQEAISEFLFENDEIPELTDSSLEVEIADDNSDFDEKRFQKMIKKSIRKAFIKLGVTVGVIVLALVIVANIVLPHIVDSMYYDPSKVLGTSESGGITTQLDTDTMVYTELFTPGYYRFRTFSNSKGFGEYDIQILQNITLNGQFKTVYGTIDKGKMSLFNDNMFKLPAQNSFVSEGVEGFTGFDSMGAAGSPEDALRKLNKLDESDHYIAFVTFDKIMTYDEFVAWSDKTNITPDWCAVCEVQEGGVYDYSANGIMGFNYLGNAGDICYDKEKYPYLNLFDVIDSVEDYRLNKAPSEVMETHMISMLRYMMDNKEFREMAGCIVNDMQLRSLKENIEEHGLNIYGFAITAQKDKILEISEKENVHYIYAAPMV